MFLDLFGDFCSLLPLDDVAFVQQSLSPSTSATSASVSRGMPLGTGKHQAVSRSSSHAAYYGDVSENSSALGRRPRSRPITNITQAQIRNSGNSFLTSVANSTRCHHVDGVAADIGGSCSPTWLNLMTHPRSSTGTTDGAPANSTSSSGRHKVQRSATCRTRSVSRVPLSVLVGDQTMSDGLDSENLRTMLQGLSLTEPDDSGADSPINGGCQVMVRNSATVSSSSAHSVDPEKVFLQGFSVFVTLRHIALCQQCCLAIHRLFLSYYLFYTLINNFINQIIFKV